MGRLALRGLAAVVSAFVLWVLLFRFVPLPATPLMGIRLAQGYGFDKQWVSLDDLPEHVARAVVASEDARFCEHHGVDSREISRAVRDWRDGDTLRGASTLSMQTAKNVFLWPGRSWLRKALELPLTGALELLWGKRRILEVYLNVAELGRGVYGVQAAARHHFGVDAAELTPQQAAQLAAILPNPTERSAGQPSAYVLKRAGQVREQIDAVDLSCVGGGRTAVRDVQTRF